MTPTDKRYTLKQFADIVAFHPETIRQAANKGLCGEKMFGRWRFTDLDITRITEGRCSDAETVSTKLTFKSTANGAENLWRRPGSDIWIITSALNTALNEHGEEVFRVIASNYLRERISPLSTLPSTGGK